MNTLLKALLALAVATALGCTPHLDASKGFTDQDLHPYVGQRIRVSGTWHTNRKAGPCVSGPLDTKDATVIYLFMKNGEGFEKLRGLYRAGRDESPVEVTGVLHLRERPPPPKPPPDPRVPTTAPAAWGYYFEIQEADIRFPKK